MSAVGLGAVLILTIVVVVFRELGPETPPWLVPAVAGGGLLVFLLVLGGAAVLPGVQLDFGPPSAPPPDPQPLCGEYIDPDGYSIAPDQLFRLDEDPVLSWTPGADAPAGAEWLVEVRAPDQRLYTMTTTETSIPLSTFQLEPWEGARIDWHVRLLKDGETACRSQAWQVVRFENTMLQAEVMLPETDVEEPVEEEPVEEACTPIALAVMNANCRFGPDNVFAEMAYLLEGETAEILGRSADWAWWNVRLPETQQICWVWSGAVEAACTDGLPVIAAPPTPTPTPPPPAADTTAPPVPSPQQPTGGVTLGCSSSALLIWSTVSDPSGISGYTVEVQRSPDQASWSAAPGSPATVTGDKTSIAVECGWYYRWHVRATDGEGNTSAWSGWATFAVTLN